MLNIVKYGLIFMICGFFALLIGQMEFRGRQIGERVATGISFPASYDIVEDTKAGLGRAMRRIGAEAPPAFQAARRKLADWIQPEDREDTGSSIDEHRSQR